MPEDGQKTQVRQFFSYCTQQHLKSGKFLQEKSWFEIHPQIHANIHEKQYDRYHVDDSNTVNPFYLRGIFNCSKSFV